MFDLNTEVVMNQQKINISDLQNDWSRFINHIMHGEEVVITRVDEPIAVVSPFKFHSSLKTQENKSPKEEQLKEEAAGYNKTYSELWLG